MMLRMPRILAIAGSLRTESYNRKLLAIAVQYLRSRGAEIDLADMRELSFPLYDGDLEAQQGLPPAVAALRERIAQAQGLLIASPEYSHSIPGTFKNTIDWASRPNSQPFQDKLVALMGASPGGFGAVRSLNHLRQVFGALGSWVLPTLFPLSAADRAFDAQSQLADPKTQQRLQKFLDQFLASL